MFIDIQVLNQIYNSFPYMNLKESGAVLKLKISNSLLSLKVKVIIPVTKIHHNHKKYKNYE